MVSGRKAAARADYSRSRPWHRPLAGDAAPRPRGSHSVTKNLATVWSLKVPSRKELQIIRFYSLFGDFFNLSEYFVDDLFPLLIVA